jgi:GrpB-like predicted nucleotidyltransferase (UPF0157 family)
MFDEVQAVIGPYCEPLAVCRDFDPRAADVARQLGGLITGHLPSARVEHVGSTAVPGCAGRGIVDLLLYGAEKDIELSTDLLARLGFQQGGQAYFSQYPAYRGTWVHHGSPFLVQIYVLPAGAAEIDLIRFLRSCLRADTELTRAYAAQKRAIIVAGGADPAEYCRQKGEFLKMVLG